MDYKNAAAILPDALVSELQKYIQGGYLYIPAKETSHRGWGEVSGGRKALDERNRQILSDYQQGKSVLKLAEKYCLSEHSIRKILYKK